VYICRKEPEYVVKRGVTVKSILLVLPWFMVSLFVSPPLPVKAEMNETGIALTVADTLPYMIGWAAVRCAGVSMLTYMLKIGLVPNQARAVRVISVPDGIVWNPLTWIVCEFGRA
jgi:hypothetical protein